jgi:hypothetical protein
VVHSAKVVPVRITTAAQVLADARRPRAVGGPAVVKEKLLTTARVSDSYDRVRMPVGLVSGS